MQPNLQTLTATQLLAELVQELRYNTEAVENLQSIAADIYDLHCFTSIHCYMRYVCG